MKIKLPKLKGRNSHALDAKSRKSAGPMHDRRDERGGSKNTQSELLTIADETKEEQPETRLTSEKQALELDDEHEDLEELGLKIKYNKED